MFATSLAPEVRAQGIDVVVVHPSPMATNFFNDAGKFVTECRPDARVGNEAVIQVQI